ncbi:hypothetical protein C8Q70DRAFT_61520 [Cubamyces menziesii]|nr:hypothetical protein C8Q70DRAFT_61520 [Cubamyces menziesii]
MAVEHHLTSWIFTDDGAVDTPSQSYPGLIGGQFTWLPTFAAGTRVTFQLHDSEGFGLGGDASLTNIIQSGPDNCLGADTSSANWSKTTTRSSIGSTTTSSTGLLTTASTSTVALANTSVAATAGYSTTGTTGSTRSSNSVQSSSGSAPPRSAFTSSPSSATLIPTMDSAVIRRGVSVGWIVGAPLGGAMLILVGVLLLWRRMVLKRSRRVDHQSHCGGPGLPDTIPEPFVASRVEKSLGIEDPTPANTPPASAFPLSPVDYSSDLPPTPGSSCNGPGTDHTIVSRRSEDVRFVPRRTRREIDGGSVHMDDESALGSTDSTLTLPPSYEDVPPRRRL